jgi:hypothetical protein
MSGSGNLWYRTKPRGIIRNLHPAYAGVRVARHSCSGWYSAVRAQVSAPNLDMVDTYGGEGARTWGTGLSGSN